MTDTGLQEIREKLGLTKAELAEKLNIKPMLLGRYEKGSCAIPEEIAEKVKELTNPQIVEEDTSSSLEADAEEISSPNLIEDVMPAPVEKEAAPTLSDAEEETDIPTLIKNIRSVLGLSHATFAKMIGVSVASIGFYENENRPET